MANNSIISGRLDVDTRDANKKLNAFQQNLDFTFEKYKETIRGIKEFTLKLSGKKNLDFTITGLDSVQQYLTKIRELNSTAPSVTRFNNAITKLSDLSKAINSDGIQKLGDSLGQFAVDVVGFSNSVANAGIALSQFNNLVRSTKQETQAAGVWVKDLARAMTTFNLLKSGRLDFKFDAKSMDEAEKQMTLFVNKMIKQVEILEASTAAVGKELNKGAFTRLGKEAKQAGTAVEKISQNMRIASRDTREFAIDIRAINTVLGVIGYSAFANQIKSIAKSMIDATAKTEEYKSSLLAVTKSQARTNELFAQFQQYSIKTPFELPDVMEAGIKLEAVTKKLKGFKMSTEEALELAGDLSMTFGKDLRVGVDTIAKALGGSAESVEMLRNNFGVARPDLERFGVAVSRQGGVMLRTEAEIHNYIRAIKEIQKEVSGLQALDFREGNLATAIAAIGDNLFKLYNELGKSILPIIKIFANALSALLNKLQDLPTIFKQGLAVTILFAAGTFLFAEKLAGLAIILSTIINLTEKKAAADALAAAAAEKHAAAEATKAAAVAASAGVTGAGAAAAGGVLANTPGFRRGRRIGPAPPNVIWHGEQAVEAGAAANVGKSLFPTFSAFLGGLFGGSGLGGLISKAKAFLATPLEALALDFGAFGSAMAVATGAALLLGPAILTIVGVARGFDMYKEGQAGANAAKGYYAFRERQGDYAHGVEGLGGDGLYTSRQMIEEGNIALTADNRNSKSMSKEAISRRYQKLLKMEQELSAGGEENLSETNKAELKSIRASLNTTRENLNVVTGRSKIEGASLTELNYREQLKEVDRNLDIAKLGGADETSALAAQIPVLQKIVEETAKDKDLVEVNLEARKQLIQRLNEQVEIMKLLTGLSIKSQQTGVYWMSVQQKANLLQQEIASMVGNSQRDQIERAKKQLELQHMTTLELQLQNNEYAKLAREGKRAGQEFVSIEEKIADKKAEIDDKRKLRGYAPVEDKYLYKTYVESQGRKKNSNFYGPGFGSQGKGLLMFKTDLVKIPGKPGSTEYKADQNQLKELEKQQDIVKRERLMKEYEYTKSEWSFKINQANLASIELGKLITDQHTREMILLEEKKKVYREYYKMLADSARDYAKATLDYNDQFLSNKLAALDIKDKYGYHTESSRIALADSTYKNKTDQLKIESNAKIDDYFKQIAELTKAGNKINKEDKQKVSDLNKLIELEKEALKLRLQGAELDRDKLFQENQMKKDQNERENRKGDLELARDRIKYKQDMVLNEIKNPTPGSGSNSDLPYILQDTMKQTYQAEAELLRIRKEEAEATLKDAELARELKKIKFEELKLGQEQLKTYMDINAEIRKQKKEKEDEKRKAFLQGGEFTTGALYGSYEEMQKADQEKEKARLDAQQKKKDADEEAAARLRDQFIGERLFKIKKIGPRDKILNQDTDLSKQVPNFDVNKTLENQDLQDVITGCFGGIAIAARKEINNTSPDSIMGRMKEHNEKMKNIENTVDVVIHLEDKVIKRQRVNLTGLDKARGNPYNYDQPRGGI